MVSYKVGNKHYWRNKKTGAAYREGASSNRKTKRIWGLVGDGWMSQERHNRNKRRAKF